MANETNFPICMTESEKRRSERQKEAATFAANAIEQCKQMNFTIKQFRQIMDILDVKRKILSSYTEDAVRMGSDEDGVMLKDEVSEFADNLIKQCQQHNFTISQFSQIIEAFDLKHQLLKMGTADTVRMKN